MKPKTTHARLTEYLRLMSLYGQAWRAAVTAKKTGDRATARELQRQAARYHGQAQRLRTSFRAV